jgi:hypothetical protein
MKNIELKLISELMKNSRRSDRELAKAIGVSQPTVSRLIKKLENQVSDSYVDAFCGRVPRSILAKHYLDYSPRNSRLSMIKPTLPSTPNLFVLSRPYLNSAGTVSRSMERSERHFVVLGHNWGKESVPRSHHTSTCTCACTTKIGKGDYDES